MLLTRLPGFAFTTEQERLLWLAGSVLLYVLGTNVAWAFRRVKCWPLVRRALAGLVQFTFYVGIPYAALLGGVITSKSLGVVELPQRESLDQGVGVAIGAVALMGLMGWHYRRAVVALGEKTPWPLEGVWQVPDRPWGWVPVLVGVAYQQIHWAFYRSLPFLILEDRYAGAFLGLALVLLEAYANPRTRRDLADPARAGWLLVSAGFAVVSTVLFVLTGTSWLGAGVHLAVTLGWILFTRITLQLR